MDVKTRRVRGTVNKVWALMQQAAISSLRLIDYRRQRRVVSQDMPRSKNDVKPVVLRKFNISSIEDTAVVVFVGKRQTGKSFLVRDLLYYKQDIPVATVISGTEGANKFFSKIIPKPFIHDEYDEDISERVISRQKRVSLEKNAEVLAKGTSDIDCRALYLLDDCMYDNKWTKSKVIRSIFMNGRHYHIMFMLTMQYSLGIPPNLRTNIDYVFILRESIFSNRKRLYDAYAGMFRTFQLFCKVMDACTEDYNCLVIHNNAKSNRLEDQVFWYKADSHPDFRLGHPSFWEYADGITDEYTLSVDDDFGDSGAHVVKVGPDGGRLL